MNNLVPVMRCLNNFRVHSNSYKYLSCCLLLFLVWQISFNILVKIYGGSIVTNKIIIFIAYTVFIIGVIILVKALWDFYQVVIRNVFSSEVINKPIWLFDSFIILYLIVITVLATIN